MERNLEKSIVEFPEGWNDVCKYASMGCETAKNNGEYCAVNRGEECCAKADECARNLGIETNSY